MKATVDAKAFCEALELVRRAPKNSALPCLKEVSVRFARGRCTLLATDLDTWLTVELSAQGDDFSLTLCQTRAVSKACRHFDGVLTLEAEDNHGKSCQSVVFSCGPRSGVFTALPADEVIPTLPQVEDQVSFTINAAELLERIERVRYAAKKPDQNSKPVQTCVQFNRNRVYSLDGYRLACDTSEALSIPRPFLVPGDSLACLKLFGNRSVSVRLGAHFVQFSDGSLSLFCRIAGEAPFDLDAAVPQCFQDEFYVSPKDFLRELEYMKTFLLHGGKPYVRFCNGELSLCGGSGQCRTAVEWDGSSTIEFGFNLHYMADALRQFKDAGRVKLKISGVSSPIVMEAEGRGDFALLLPVRLNGAAAA